MENKQQIFLQLPLTTIQKVGGPERQNCAPRSFTCFLKRGIHHNEPKNLLSFQHASKCGRFQYSACKQPNKEDEIAEIQAADMFSMARLQCFDASG